MGPVFKLLVINCNALYTSLGTIMHPYKLILIDLERDCTPFQVAPNQFLCILKMIRDHYPLQINLYSFGEKVDPILNYY